MQIEYLENAQGAMMPVDKIRPEDLKRHLLVGNLVSEAKAMQTLLKEHKEKGLEQVHLFIDDIAREYGTKIGGSKGNVVLSNYSQTQKVMICVNDVINFTEELMIAEQLVSECLEEWSDGANANLVAFVKEAFHRTKEGGVSVSKMLGLMRLEIKEEKWVRAMSALKNSMIAGGSKSYFRIYERKDQDHAWEQVALDIARV